MRVVFGISALIWVMYLLLASTWQPSWMPDFSLIRRLTTYEDPLDGLTRSIYASAHGNIVAAFKLNPLFPAYIGIVFYGIYISLRICLGTVDSVNPKPILAITGVAMALTIAIRVLVGVQF